MHGYQGVSTQHIIDHPFAGLFLEMGLGKTVSTLTAIKELLGDLDISDVLVIAPKRVVELVWDAEVEKWEHVRGLKLVKIIGPEIKRKAALREPADIHLISRDNIAWLCCQYGGGMLPWDMLVIDESSSFKNANSVRFKALRKVQPSFDRVLLLTGTPAPNSLMDLWPQLYMLDRGERLGQTLGEYRREYFQREPIWGTQQSKYLVIEEREKRLHDKISDICISMKAEDYLDLPKRIDNHINIVFTPALEKQYQDFEKEKVLEVFESTPKDEPITAANAAALAGKLLQFANGAVYDLEKNYHVVHDLKLDALAEIVDASGGKPILVAYSFRHDMYRIKERFKHLNPRELKTKKDLDDWNAGKIQMLVMHPASGGHGLNLQMGGHIIVWYGQNWSLELYKQLNARLDRQGQTERVIAHHLIILGTMDEAVLASLEAKDKRQEGLMQAVKALRQKYLG